MRKQRHAIVVSGYIGLEGSSVLADVFADKIDAYYPGYLARECREYAKGLIPNLEKAAEIAQDYALSRRWTEEDFYQLKISEGGILTALWSLAKMLGSGYELELRKIPIKQETVEICELLEVNPYHLWSDGAYVFACNDGEGLIKELASGGISAHIVGYTNDTKAHVLNNDGIVSHINRPEPDELVRLGIRD